MTNQQPDNAQLTIESCVATCAAQNFTVAAAEYSVGQSFNHLGLSLNVFIIRFNAVSHNLGSNALNINVIFSLW
jgi:hypothetical protein